MPGLSPKDKGEAKSAASSPRACKMVNRHITPPPITHPGEQYESEDDKVLKGPKVVQLLPSIFEMRKHHKKLSDQVAEPSLELKSLKDDYDTLRHGLCSKVNNLARTIGKDSA
jgi:hypothetical protein